MSRGKTRQKRKIEAGQKEDGLMEEVVEKNKEGVRKAR